MLERLFVYGTLAPGKRNHFMLEDIPGNWQPAALQGVLINEGWGALHDCPGIVPDETAAFVNGQLFSSHELNAHWDALDEFEGEDYSRKVVMVRIQDGSFVEASVYAVQV
ncbi:MAG: gamma-glutamylcyclotransferase family protein [Pseudomonadota bacterium]